MIKSDFETITEMLAIASGANLETKPSIISLLDDENQEKVILQKTRDNHIYLLIIICELPKNNSFINHKLLELNSDVITLQGAFISSNESTKRYILIKKISYIQNQKEFDEIFNQLLEFSDNIKAYIQELIRKEENKTDQLSESTYPFIDKV